MAVTVASAHLDDRAFLAALDNCSLPLANFRHGDHLRLAWLQLHRSNFDEALQDVHAGIQRYAAHHGVAHIFHHTITSAWVMLLATHGEPTFAEFLQQNDSMLNKELLHRFWTPASLRSAEAKADGCRRIAKNFLRAFSAMTNSTCRTSHDRLLSGATCRPLYPYDCMSDGPRSVGAAAFAYRDFRLYQSARALVIMGAEAQSVAVAWQVYQITHQRARPWLHRTRALPARPAVYSAQWPCR